MTDDSDNPTKVSIRRIDQPPAIRLAPAVPSLPSSSGAWFGSPTTILKKDTAFVAAHTGYLRARRDQADAMTALIESRAAAALAMASIAALPEIADHACQRGRAERTRERNDWQHQARVAALDRERVETDALAALLHSRQRLADLEPKPPEPPAAPSHVPAAPPPSSPPGLTPDEVGDVLSNLPDIAPETLQTITRLLSGFLREKES